MTMGLLSWRAAVLITALLAVLYPMAQARAPHMVVPSAGAGLDAPSPSPCPSGLRAASPTACTTVLLLQRPLQNPARCVKAGSTVVFTDYLDCHGCELSLLPLGPGPVCRQVATDLHSTATDTLYRCSPTPSPVQAVAAAAAAATATNPPSRVDRRG